MPKTTIIFLLTLCLLIGTLSLEVKAENPQLSINADVYVLLDSISGRILLEKNSTEKRAMASTTKIMTAIIALEQGNLQSQVVVSPRAASIGGSSFFLKTGETFSLENILYGLLLPSGNDAAVAIAEYIGGTEENFVKMMNEKAVELGALNTHFKNPHGLDEPGHYTTAKDLALIARYAWNIYKFREIVQTKSKEIKDGNYTRQIFNTNKLLWEFDGANGIKTGYTGKAGKCLVASAFKNDFQLLSIVLGTHSHFGDSFQLLNYGFNNYKQTTLAKKSKNYATIPVQNGTFDEIELGIKSNINLPLSKREKFRLKPVVPKKTKAPINKGQQIGELQVYIDENLVHSAPLFAMKDVEVKNYKYILNKIFQFWIKGKQIEKIY